MSRRIREYVEPQLVVSSDNVAWAAGIYEGEGTVGKRSNVSVTQKDPWILYRLQTLYGGNVSQYDKKSGAYRWVIYGEEARDFLRAIWPWLSPRRKEQAQPVLDKTYRVCSRNRS